MYEGCTAGMLQVVYIGAELQLHDRLCYAISLTADIKVVLHPQLLMLTDAFLPDLMDPACELDNKLIGAGCQVSKR